jgi:NADPH:quinone reductase-like Zn-dependent oxidoreductase
VPGHELSGVVAELGYGTTGLTVGQRVFGLTDWTRNGSLAEYAGRAADRDTALGLSADAFVDLG